MLSGRLDLDIHDDTRLHLCNIINSGSTILFDPQYVPILLYFVLWLSIRIHLLSLLGKKGQGNFKPGRYDTC